MQWRGDGAGKGDGGDERVKWIVPAMCIVRMYESERARRERELRGVCVRERRLMRRLSSV